jgi:hypothetical protein
MEGQLPRRELAALEGSEAMSAPVPNANYAPTGYERVSLGHYRRCEDDPEERAIERAIQFLREESEVMPNGAGSECSRRSASVQAYDMRPPSAMGTNRLDDIATFVRLLTYGEMMDLAAALWKMRPEGKEITEQELPGMWHRWSNRP